MNVIGKNLKKNIGEATGLSQQELANCIAVTRQTISNWERGVSLPDIDTVLLLAKKNFMSKRLIFFTMSVQELSFN